MLYRKNSFHVISITLYKPCYLSTIHFKVFLCSTSIFKFSQTRSRCVFVNILTFLLEYINTIMAFFKIYIKKYIQQANYFLLLHVYLLTFSNLLFTISLAVLMTAITYKLNIYDDYNDLKILHFTLRPILIPAPCSAGSHMTKN